MEGMICRTCRPPSRVTSRMAPLPAHFVTFPLNSGGHVCRMRGRKVRNEQDARGEVGTEVCTP